jgi:hypothetical protein
MTSYKSPYPALYCAGCNRKLGANACHLVIAEQFVICTNCHSSREVHKRLYPDCPKLYHDMGDHKPVSFATRAGVYYHYNYLTDGTPPLRPGKSLRRDN